MKREKRFQSIAAALTYAVNTLRSSAGVCFVEEVGGYTSMINKSVMRVGCLCNTLKHIQAHDDSLWLKEMASTVSAWLKLKNYMITNICFQIFSGYLWRCRKNLSDLLLQFAELFFFFFFFLFLI